MNGTYTAARFSRMPIAHAAMTTPIGLDIPPRMTAVYVPFIGYDLKIAVPFILIFVVLILRPQGLFGRKDVVRV